MLIEITKNKDLALFILRIALGLPLILHGLQKTFGLFGGSGLKEWSTYVSSLNIPYTSIKFPKISGLLSAYLELICGILILLGIQVKLASILMIIFLLFAIKLAHLDNGYFSSKGGYEYALTLLLIACSLVILESGKYKIKI
jgi:putative oxidoreductase